MTFDSNPEHPQRDELLERAAIALRDAPAPEGPSAALLRTTRDAIRREQLVGFWRGGAMRRIAVGVAAGVALAIGLAGIYRVTVRHAAHDAGALADRHSSVSPTPSGEPTRQGSPANGGNRPTGVAKSGSPKVAPPAAVAVANDVIAGRAWFVGPRPTPMPIPASEIMPACQHDHGAIYDESLLVSQDGGLANVVVSISSGLAGWLREEYPPAPGPAVLDQKGCVFHPHVIAVMVGEPLLVKNSDPFLHNVHLLAVNNPEANVGQPTMAEMATAPFESPEVFQVKCDIHPWMQAWVRVLDNPYFAVTGSDGRFTIRGLPPGTYTLKAWHERLGVREAQVTIGPGATPSVDFAFQPGGERR